MSVITIAGQSHRGFKDGVCTEALLELPIALCISRDGKCYFTDHTNHCIRMIWNGHVTSIAGNGQKGYLDGNVKDALFNSPEGLCIDSRDRIYIADTFNHRIRMIDQGQVSTIAGNGEQCLFDGRTMEASFCCPRNLCVSHDGKIYVSDDSNHRIRMIDKDQVCTIAGTRLNGYRDGQAMQALFNTPMGICTSEDGKIYVADTSNHCIRMIYKNQVTTIAGTGTKGFQDGEALHARFDHPHQLCMANDAKLYIADTMNHRIRLFHKDQVVTIAGSMPGFEDGAMKESTFTRPRGVCVAQDGKIYVADFINNRIRMIDCYFTGHCLFGNMQQTQCLVDNQIMINNMTFNVTKRFIQARCPSVLDPLCDGLTWIKTMNISARTIHMFMEYLYTNSIPEVWVNHSSPLMSTEEYSFDFDGCLEFLFLLDALNMTESRLDPLFHYHLNLLTHISFAIDKLIHLVCNAYKMLQCVSMAMLNTLESSPSPLASLPSSTSLPSSASSLSLPSSSSCTRPPLDVAKPKCTPPSASTSYMVRIYKLLLNCFKNSRKSFQSSHIDILKSRLSANDVIRVMTHLLLVTTNSDFHSIVNHEWDPLSPTMHTSSSNALLQLSQIAFQSTFFANHTSLSSSIPSSMVEWCRPDFIIRLCNDDDQCDYPVHQFILCGRWRYFRLLLESGLKEAKERVMVLPEDWNVARLKHFITYIYLNEITFRDIEDIRWLVEHTSLYHVADHHPGDNQDEERMLQLRPCVGFESLYQYCVNTIQQPLTMDNIIDQYKMFEQLGFSRRLKKAQSFIAENLARIMKHPSTREAMKLCIDPNTLTTLLYQFYQ